ncbi:MAG TPA: XdhC/CoxI family protein [Limnochordia bacterium]
MFAQLAERLGASRAAVVVTVIDGEGSAAALVGRKALVGDGRIITGGLDGGGPLDRWAIGQEAAGATGYECETLELPWQAPDGAQLRVRLFVERFGPPPTLLIVGAGHIAVPTARIGKIVGFRTVVVDDRPQFANADRFPDADRIVVCDFGDLLTHVRIDAATYVVIVTRGHKHDAQVLPLVIGSEAAYIGMIGSRRRVKTVIEALLAAGTPKAALERVYAPIGIDIGAETPEEIALAILAEITNVRRGGSARSLRMTPRFVGPRAAATGGMDHGRRDRA